MRRAATEYYHDTQESPITIEIVKLLKTERVELQLVRMASRPAGRVLDFGRIKLTQPAGA